MFWITNQTALELLLDRVAFWVKNDREKNWWDEYLANWLDIEYNNEFNPYEIIDNMFVNEKQFIDKKLLTKEELKLGVGEYLQVETYCAGIIEYIGEDFVVIDLR